MTNKEKLQEAVWFLEANGGRAPREAKKLLAAQGDIVYPKDTCAQIADDAYFAVMKIAAASCRAQKPVLSAEAADAIKDILKNWRALSAQNGDVKQFEIEKNIKEIEVRIAVFFDMKKEIPMSKSIKNVVYKYLDETIKIAQLVDGGQQLPQNAEVQQGIALLKEIKALCVAAMDDRSKQANDYAADIIGHITLWRNAMQDGLLTAEDSANLAAGRGSAHKWRQILRIPTAKECVKDADRVQYFEDERFTNQIKGKLLDDRTTKFFELLNQRKTTVNEAGGVLYHDLGVAEAERNGLEQEDARIMSQYENGEITLRTWNDLLETNKRKRAMTDRRIVGLKRMIAQDTAIKDKINEVIENFKVLQYYYDIYILTAPTTVYDIFSQLDYSAFARVLNNSATPEETNLVKVGLGAAIESIRVYDARFAKSNEDILNIVNRETAAVVVKEEETEEMLRKKFLEEKAKRQRQTDGVLAPNVVDVERMSLNDEDN